MKNRLLGVLCLSVLTLFGPLGCNRSSSGPPAPLALDQIPIEMNKAFTKSPAEVKERVSQLNAGLEAKDYTAAYQIVQDLCNLSVATKEQRLVSIRSMFTIQGLLQTAQAQGDQKAATVLNEQKRLK